MTHVKFNPFPHAIRFQNLDKSATPSVNVIENGKEFRLEVAAPGLAKEDFKINIEDKLLTISADKKAATEAKEGERFIRREFGYNAFKRSFTLPETVDATAVKATYENSVLYVALPKTEVKKTAQVVEVH
jgi:HSP20 family protein